MVKDFTQPPHGSSCTQKCSNKYTSPLRGGFNSLIIMLYPSSTQASLFSFSFSSKELLCGCRSCCSSMHSMTFGAHTALTTTANQIPNRFIATNKRNFNVYQTLKHRIILMAQHKIIKCSKRFLFYECACLYSAWRGMAPSIELTSAPLCIF